MSASERLTLLRQYIEKKRDHFKTKLRFMPLDEQTKAAFTLEVEQCGLALRALDTDNAAGVFASTADLVEAEARFRAAHPGNADTDNAAGQAGQPGNDCWEEGQSHDFIGGKCLRCGAPSHDGHAAGPASGAPKRIDWATPEVDSLTITVVAYGEKDAHPFSAVPAIDVRSLLRRLRREQPEREAWIYAYTSLGCDWVSAEKMVQAEIDAYLVAADSDNALAPGERKPGEIANVCLWIEEKCSACGRTTMFRADNVPAAPDCWGEGQSHDFVGGKCLRCGKVEVGGPAPAAPERISCVQDDPCNYDHTCTNHRILADLERQLSKAMQEWREEAEDMCERLLKQCEAVAATGGSATHCVELIRAALPLSAEKGEGKT